jgi:hypothetical protein
MKKLSFFIGFFLHDALVSQRIRQPLNCVFSIANKHDWNTRNLANAAFQLLVASCNHIALVLVDALTLEKERASKRTGKSRAHMSLTKQSSAYVPLCVHDSRCTRGSRAMRTATRNLLPSFSSSPITQSVTYGMHLAYKQSIIPDTMSILF